MNQETGSEKKPAGKSTRKSERIKKKILKKKSKVPKTTNKKLSKWLLLIPLGLVLAGIAVAIFFFVIHKPKEEVPEVETTENIPESEPEETEPDLGQSILDHIVTAGNAVFDSYKKRPETHILTDENRSTFATISDCTINTETGLVDVTAAGEGIPKSDDKYYYLFALNTYDTEIPADSEYITREYKDNEIKMSASLNYNMPGSRLFKKFVIAVKLDDKYAIVSRSRYITNPEAIARYGSVYVRPASKKGLLVDPNRLRGNELDDLGVKQAAYNIPIARLLGPTTSAAYPTIQYTYNGKTYSINGQVVAEYDIVFGTLSAKGISTTAILLNNYSSAYTMLINPRSRGGGSAPYYMFNGSESSGVECMAAVATFLADRYSGDKHGRISNWIIANEINARKEWNYMEHTDIETYVEEYSRAFRVFYNAIKSVSSSARVYISIDQQWDRNIKNNTNYDGRDILDVFNNNIKAKGNIDWHVAQHPYNVPLTEPRIWKASKYVTHSSSTSMITMANIEVLINYLKQEQLRAPNGEVRSILLSEQGYNTQGGEACQAAAFAYAYYKVEAYPEIDGFLLNRETDAPEEVAQGLDFGLTNTGGGRKQIYTVFKYIDTPEHAQYTDFAKGIIGISNWSEIMH